MATFYLIDGHAQIYRAYFAPFRDLTGPDGGPVKAVFVFAQMLLGLVAGQKPDYLAMVIDSAGDEGLHRTALYPEYKANRTQRPDDFDPQEQRILKLVKDAGVPIYHLPGWEADDVLATLARRLEAQGFDVVLVSKDKDLRQLLSAKVKMYDVQGDRFTTPETLVAEMGFTPEQAVEIQCLMGDSTDNVPGIRGVAEKTALKLLTKFGSAQAVVDRAEEIEQPKLRESAKAFKDQLPITRQLVTLATDLEIPEFDREKCKFEGLNTVALQGHFRELGFGSLQRRLEELSPRTGGVGGGGEKKVVVKAKVKASGGEGDLFSGGLFGHDPAMGAGEETGAGAGGSVEGEQALAVDTGPTLENSVGLDYRLVNTPELFEAFLGELRQQKRFAFDSETDDLGAMYSEPIGFSFSWKTGTGWYVAIAGPEVLGATPVLDRGMVIEGLRGVMEDERVEKVGHNIKYDVLVMRNCGVRVRGVVMDTMVAAFVLDAGKMQYGIDRLAEQLLGFKKIATAELIGSGKGTVSMKTIDPARVAHYASEDADVCLRLAELFEGQLAKVPTLKKLMDEVETPLVGVLAEMEFNGIAVDPAVLKEQSVVLGARIEELRAAIMVAAGMGGGIEFNPDSPKQLAEVLFVKLGLKSVKKTKTGHSTDVEVLEKLAGEHAVPKLILEYRSLQKLKNTYLDSLTEFVSKKTGRIHTHFNPTGAATGRLSSSDPNMQNIPIRTDEGRRIRLAFVAGKKENVLLSADYSQIELRILAHYTKEPALLKAFAEDEDIHKAVAAEVFGVPVGEVSRDQRGQAKTINFGIIYGVTAYGLSRRIEGLTTGAADKLIRDYNARFPAIERFLGECVEFARTHGFVETLLGRRRPLPDVHSNTTTVRNAAERMAINTVVQGSAADLIKVAMLRIQRRIEKEGRASRMLLQVHDELVFETPREGVEAEAAMVREEMVGAMELAVPLKVEIGWGGNWGEVKG